MLGEYSRWSLLACAPDPPPSGQIQALTRRPLANNALTGRFSCAFFLGLSRSLALKEISSGLQLDTREKWTVHIFPLSLLLLIPRSWFLYLAAPPPSPSIACVRVLSLCMYMCLAFVILRVCLSKCAHAFTCMRLCLCLKWSEDRWRWNPREEKPPPPPHLPSGYQNPRWNLPLFLIFYFRSNPFSPGYVHFLLPK